MNNIDTKIRHTTEAQGNVFEDFGFPIDEAQKLKSASQQLIETKLMLMNEMSNWIDKNNLKQSEAASILGVSRPRISDMVNGKLEKFTLDTLVTFVAKTGKTIQLQLS